MASKRKGGQRAKMDSTNFLFFLFTGFGLTTCSDTNLREYHFVNQSLNWTEAQNYCREKYTDLATIESVEDLNRLKRPSGITDGSWIGLSDDPKSWWRVMSNDSNSWRWSATESDPPGHRVYTVINRSLTWTEAQTYCRTHHTDLATIENVEENAEAVSVMTTNSVSEAWIGLYRVRWRWSDNSNSSFTNWNSGQPDDLRVKKTMVRMKIQTFADLSDPATNAQILQQLSERFNTLHGDVKLRWVTQPTKQEEDDDEDNGKCYQSWAPGQPTNYLGHVICVIINGQGGWTDSKCHIKSYFSCFNDLRVKKTMVRMKIQTFADLSHPATNAQILQQLSERFKTLHIEVKLRWMTQP
ncbi:hypothetical protein INR49_001958 [Caranx melampygus]|nr:hypothetical protein INR49_001958 [Caranx melampygus]